MKTKVIDFLLWPLALILLYLIVHLAMAGIFYGFEFVVRHLITLKFIPYFIIITFILSLLEPIYLATLSLLCGFVIRFVVRQWKSLATVFSILFILENLIFIILFWAGLIEFSWGALKYHKLNNFLFSLLLLSLFYLPISIFSTFRDNLPNDLESAVKDNNSIKRLDLNATVEIKNPIEDSIAQISEVDKIEIKDNNIQATGEDKSNTKNIRIMVVDDNLLYNAVMKKAIQQCFEGIPLSTIVIVKNGEEALEIFKKNATIELIFMNILMPGIDGFETARRIRSLNKKVNIVAFTEYRHDSIKDRLNEIGFNGYLKKPLELQDLRNLLKSLFQ